MLNQLEKIYRINHHEKKKRNESESCIYNFLAQYISESQKNETQVSGNNDVKSPMYRNNTGYIATIDNGTINTLIAHYYFNC